MPTLDDARILITGGNGFIGSHLSNGILDRYPEAQVNLADMATGTTNPILHAHNIPDLLELDIRDYTRTKEIVDRIEPTHVYHLAAFVNAGRNLDLIDDAIASNVSGTTNLLRCLINREIDSIVHLGTSEVYGDNEPPFTEEMAIRPTSPYSITKAASEHFCQMFSKVHGLPVVCLRPFNVFGEGQSTGMMIPQVITSCLANKAIDLTEGRQTREVNHVHDIIDGIIKASLTRPAIGEKINLGSGKDISIRVLAERIKEMMGSSASLNFGGLAYRDNEIWRMFCDNRKAGRILGWKPKISLDEGLRRTIEWHRQLSTGPESANQQQK